MADVRILDDITYPVTEEQVKRVFFPIPIRGKTVLIKPNLVNNRHPLGLDITSVVTHGSLIRAVVDHIRGQEPARLIIGDAPLQGTDWNEVCRFTGVDGIRDVEVRDFRNVIIRKNTKGYITGMRRNTDIGFTYIDLGSRSRLQGISGDYRAYRVPEYEKKDTIRYHDLTRNMYCIARPVLEADIIVNLPKLKTHKKAGITCAMKNFIGANSNKDLVPHHRRFIDASPRRTPLTMLNEWLADRPYSTIARSTRNMLWHLIRNEIRDGAWYGNDTLWRSILDIVDIVRFADRDGIMHPEPQRQIITIVDAVVAGEGQGPLSPTPKRCDMIFSGMDLTAVDLVASRIMGFDWRSIPHLRHAPHPGPVSVSCLGNRTDGEYSLEHLPFDLRFVPAVGWKGHIERASGEEGTSGEEVTGFGRTGEERDLL